MTASERWRRVQALCDELDGLPEAEVTTRLAALEPDAEIQRETAATLAALRAEAACARPARSTPVVLAPPETVGGVRILERLGSGGSGEVFRGVRQVNGADQEVAVKRFHAHRAESADRERFAREQQMLASLTHPDIVRLYDGGIGDDGRPYLVMEFVDGQPITTACDLAALPLRRRLVLFLAVCNAVQAAHQRLIVHLDLKPSNILMTPDGRPKLLDFGTAKLADPAIGMTRTEPLTLQYASPERLRGEAVSVACDVYSLGLILCELASGAWPFRRKDSLVAVAERASGALDLVPLSRLVHEDSAAKRGLTADRLRAALRGDVEAIAARALAHEPGERYSSVAELAEDIRRHLDGDPVRARPPGAAYLLGKFLKRHKWQVASVALVVVALAGAAAYSLAQARASRAAAERAQAQNRFLTSLFTLAGTDATSKNGMTVRQLLELADARVSPLLTGQPDVAGDVDLTLAHGLVSQSAYDQAERLVERARARAVEHHDVTREAAARALVAYLHFVRSRPAEATAEARTALAMWREHEAGFGPDLAAYTLATASVTLAFVNPPDPEPVPFLEACLDLTERHASLAYTTRPICLFTLGAVRFNAEERFDAAEVLLTEAATLQRLDPTQQSSLVMTLQLLGIVQRVTGRFAEDEAAQREALDVIARLYGADSISALWQQAVWATSLVGAGRAEDGYREAMQVLEGARRRYPERGTNMLWTPLSAASTAACFLEKYEECDALTTEALQTLGPNPPANDARARTARALLGLVYARRGEHERARPLLQAAVDATQGTKRVSVFLPRWQAALAAMPPASTAVPASASATPQAATK